MDPAMADHPIMKLKPRQPKKFLPKRGQKPMLPQAQPQPAPMPMNMMRRPITG